MTPLEALSWKVNAGVWIRFLQGCEPGCYLLLDYEQCRTIVELLKHPVARPQLVETEPVP